MRRTKPQPTTQPARATATSTEPGARHRGDGGRRDNERATANVETVRGSVGTLLGRQKVLGALAKASLRVKDGPNDVPVANANE